MISLLFEVEISIDIVKLKIGFKFQVKEFLIAELYIYFVFTIWLPWTEGKPTNI